MPPPGDPDYPAYGPPGYPGYGPPANPGYGPPANPGYGPPANPGYPGYPGHPGYQVPGYPGYQPPGYNQPAYSQPGYQPPSYSQPAAALKPGIIPLQPLSLGDIFNGAVGYVRANPAATLGLTAIVVVITRALMLLLEVGPLAALTRWASGPSGEELTGDDVMMGAVSLVGGTIATSLSTVVLTGMLTVVIGRAVFGSPITIGEAWAKVRGRLPALLGFAALMALGGVAVIGLAVLAIIAAATVAGPVAAVLLGVPVALVVAAGICYLYTMLSFAATSIVLERLSVFAAIARSFALVRNSFWRVLGILALAAVVSYLVASAVGFPFSIVGMVLDSDTQSAASLPMSSLVSAVGTAIGEIIIEPFTAGVVVLLYTDRRIRAEAFDLVLRTGAAGVAGSGAPAESTDGLWLTRPV